MSKKKDKNFSAKYKNGGDGMFFYHKKTRHPAKQISHAEKLGRIEDIPIVRTGLKIMKKIRRYLPKKNQCMRQDPYLSIQSIQEVGHIE